MYCRHIIYTISCACCLRIAHDVYNICKKETMKSGKIFYLSPAILIFIVLIINGICSLWLTPLLLTIPLLFSYYASIWISILLYKKTASGQNPVIIGKKLKPDYTRFTAWMYLWDCIYPLVSGIPVFILLGALLPLHWLLVGILFSIINAPSEEAYWRIFLERAGRDAGLSEKTRLWYSSTLFSLWHFIFIVFLFPPQIILPSLMGTLIMTFISGLLWMKVYQETENMFANILSHAVLNFLMIWPAGATIVLGLNPYVLK